MNRGHIRHRHALSFSSALSFWQISLCFSKNTCTPNPNGHFSPENKYIALFFFSSAAFDEFDFQCIYFLVIVVRFLFFANPPPPAFLFSPIGSGRANHFVKGVIYLFAHEKIARILRSIKMRLLQLVQWTFSCLYPCDFVCIACFFSLSLCSAKKERWKTIEIVTKKE